MSIPVLHISGLRYPTYDVRTKKVAGKFHIFDQVRKKWLKLSPEEWVRQHLVNHLIQSHNVPASRISIEKELKLNGLSRRYDVVIYDNSPSPWLIVECKAPYVDINAPVLEQALRYNLTIGAEFLLITNGIAEFVFNRRGETVPFPVFSLSH